METQVEITVKKKVKIYLKHYTDFQAPRVGVHQWFMGIEEKREIVSKQLGYGGILI